MTANSIAVAGQQYTQEQLDESFSLSQLVELYNKRADKPVKSFRDKPTALRRVMAIYEAAAPAKPEKKKQPEKLNGDKPKKKVLQGTIKMLIASNPKRQNTLAYEKFKMLASMDGKTVEEYTALEGNTPDIDQYEVGWARTELRWCIKKGWCEVIPATE